MKTSTSRKLPLAVLCVAVMLSLSTAARGAADVSGTWNFVMNTDGGERQSRATFKVDGKTVTGTWGEKTEVKGTFADDALDLSFPIESPEAGPGTLTIKARLANDELSGSWSFQQYGGTLKATRAAPSR
jgi:hypothetical protein